MATSNGSRNGRAVPPRPAHAPQPTTSQRPNRTVNNKFDVRLPDMPSLPPLSLTVSKTVVNNTGGGTASKELPGSGFTSDEDVRAFCEGLRRHHRPRAVLRTLDAETLDAVLRAIPDSSGSLSGSRARARRVTRHLKRIAAAEMVAAKSAAALWAAFTREFDSELQLSRGRPPKPRHAPFRWKA